MDRCILIFMLVDTYKCCRLLIFVHSERTSWHIHCYTKKLNNNFCSFACTSVEVPSFSTLCSHLSALCSHLSSLCSNSSALCSHLSTLCSHLSILRSHLSTVTLPPSSYNTKRGAIFPIQCWGCCLNVHRSTAALIIQKRCSFGENCRFLLNFGYDFRTHFLPGF